METVLKFDKCILIKELNEEFNQVGKSYEIADILDNSFLLRDFKTKVVVGVIDFNDFDKYFVSEQNFKGWTPWTKLMGDVFYRTNRRKTQVKIITDKVRAEACCCKKDNDEFNLYFGIQLAYLRARNKVLAKKKIEFENNLKETNKEIADNNKTMKKMINGIGA